MRTANARIQPRPSKREALDLVPGNVLRSQRINHSHPTQGSAHACPSASCEPEATGGSSKSAKDESNGRVVAHMIFEPDHYANADAYAGDRPKRHAQSLFAAAEASVLTADTTGRTDGDQHEHPAALFC